MSTWYLASICHDSTYTFPCFQGTLTNTNLTHRVGLPCIGKASKDNVGPVVFDGDISITQKAAGNRCTLRLRNSEYSLQENRFVLGCVDDNERFMLVGYFSMTEKIPDCSIDTDKGDDESIALASACPLATLSSTFREVRLVVPSDPFKWKQDAGSVTSKPEVLRSQLAHLCMGHSPSIVGPTATPALSNHAAKGEGKGVDTPVESDPVTVPASEKLKTFMQKADERRAAAKAAAVKELATMEHKHIDEKVKLEQEQSETQQLLEQDIAAELEALRFDVQMDGS